MGYIQRKKEKDDEEEEEEKEDSEGEIYCKGAARVRDGKEGRKEVWHEPLSSIVWPYSSRTPRRGRDWSTHHPNLSTYGIRHIAYHTRSRIGKEVSSGLRGAGTRALSPGLLVSLLLCHPPEVWVRA